jgi:hypothetical protein
MKDHESQYLRRREASDYLREQHGICRAPATLAKLAVTGGGPRFRHVGRVPIYPVAELDAYAAAITSALKCSTSDAGSPSTSDPTVPKLASGPTAEADAVAAQDATGKRHQCRRRGIADCGGARGP